MSNTKPDSGRLTRVRPALLGLAAARGLLSLVAVLLAPALYRDHFVILVLLRPTKEVLLAGGFFVRRGDVSLLPILVAAIPMILFGVWLFYALGRAYADEVQSGEGLPKWAGKILPRDRIQGLCRILDKKGTGVVIAGRLAAFPSSLLAAAAGASGMAPAKFLPADALGAALSIAEVVGAGFVLGEAYEKAGPWVTAVGVAVLFGMLFVVGRWLKREGKRNGGTKDQGSSG